MRKTLKICLFYYFTRYVNCKLIKFLSLYFYKLMGKIEEHERNIDLMGYDYMIDEILKK